MTIPIHTTEGMLLNLYLMVGSLALAFLAHEIGHVLSFKRKGRLVKVSYLWGGDVEVGEDIDYKVLSRDDKEDVYASGVLAGFFVLIPSLFFLFPSFSVSVLAVYLAGCKHDLVMLYRLTK